MDCIGWLKAIYFIMSTSYKNAHLLSGNTDYRHPLFRPGHVDMDTNVSTVQLSSAFSVVAQEYCNTFNLISLDFFEQTNEIYYINKRNLNRS